MKWNELLKKIAEKIREFAKNLMGKVENALKGLTLTWEEIKSCFEKMAEEQTKRRSNADAAVRVAVALRERREERCKINKCRALHK